MPIEHRTMYTRLASMAVMLGAAASPAWADVGPPIEIKMAPDTQPAVSGEEYRGVFVVHVYRPGTLANVELRGEGWTIITADIPDGPLEIGPGDLRIPFHAIPVDANKPIELSLTHSDRRVTRAYEIGPAYFDQIGKPFAVRQIAAQSRVRPDGAVGPPEGVAGDAIPLHFVGRIVYTRIGLDLSNPPDGDFNDPGDVPPQVVGVDRIRVRVIDDDDISSETIWSALTDVNGFFDSGVIMWDDCDAVGCDTPDLVLEFEADTGVVDVTDNSILEETYTWQTEEITDFPGSFYDFGVATPGDASLMPALHIFNSIVRVERYIRTTTTYDPPKVQVEWPDGTAGAFYEDESVEIHISSGRQWREDTHSHEFGHHFIHFFSESLDPDYCNNFCDGTMSCTSGTDCENTGHCIWCPETDHDAFNEGWPNWLADVVTRSYPLNYQNDDGSPYQPLFTRSQENLSTCCQDGQTYSAFITEGFVGALLRDIEDNTQDDHDADGITDLLCVGAEDIFDVVVQVHPINVLDFIAGFLLLYPDEIDGLWATAFNVAPTYVAAFPPDTQPPGVVEALDSLTHPLGIGGPLPCVTVMWVRPSDDLTGVCDYSFTWTTDPAGDEPDETPDAWSYNGCFYTAPGAFGLGEYYFSIKTMDCGGTWASEWSKFGPFEVVDCNGTGSLDLCDIDCAHPGYPGCSLSPAFCTGAPGCGLSPDCQPNLAPDECDIADGTSQDCNEDAIPDECELIGHSVTGGLWDDPQAWTEEQVPADGSHVCIDGSAGTTVTFQHGPTDVAILACHDNLSLNQVSFPWPEMTLTEASFVRGNLALTGQLTTLDVNDTLDIDGTLDWFRGKIGGPGTTHVNGTMQIGPGVAEIDNHRVILGGGGVSVSMGRIDFPGASTFQILAGATFDHQSAFDVVSGWFDDEFDNDGTLIKSVDPGQSGINIFTDNSGLMHVTSGELALTLGSSSTGDFLGDTGTTLVFGGGGHDLLPDSSLVADRVRFDSGTSGENHIRGTYNVATETMHAGQALTFTDEANIVNYAPAFLIPKGTVNFDAIVGGPTHFDTFSVGTGGAFGGTANFNTGEPVDVDVLTLGPGSINGPSILTVNGLLTWRASGHFTGPGIIHANGGLVVEPGGGEKALNNRTLNNAAVATMQGGFTMQSGAIVNNLVSGTIDIQADSGGAIIGGGTQDTINNDGMFVKTAGPGTSDITPPFFNSATVEVQIGVMRFDHDYLQTAGQTILSGGDIEMWPFPYNPMEINGGALTGIGSVIGDVIVAGGVLEPGITTGTLHVDGNYTQQMGGTMSIELAGTAPGQSDLLDVTGVAVLAGELHVIEITPFVAQPGDSFIIITAPTISGTFDSVIAPKQIVVQYNATDVTIKVPVPGDIDDDGDVDVHDYAALQDCFSGAGVAYPPGCANADLDDDGDVDLDDYTLFFAIANAP